MSGGQIALFRGDVGAEVTHGAARFVVLEGDARELVPRIAPGAVALMLTDPPYGISREGAEITRAGAAPIRQDFGAWDRSEVGARELVRAVLLAAGGAVAGDGASYVWTSDALFGAAREALGAAGFPALGFAVWCKTNPAPSVRQSGWLSAAELIVWGRRPGNRFGWPGHHGAYNWLTAPVVPHQRRIRDEQGRVHPAEKPQDVARRLIRASTRPGDVVLDPFAGSGAIGEAALREGRRYIGIELDPVWARAARAWLEQVAAEEA